jgi:HlyD family secretion protein
MGKRRTLVMFGVLVMALMAIGRRVRGPAAAIPVTRAPRADVTIAAQGRVEGTTEVVEVAAGIPGIVQEVTVEEGQRVERGQVLIRIECETLAADLSEATAAVAIAEEQRKRLLRGARDEERQVALAEMMAAAASKTRAASHFKRVEGLGEMRFESQEGQEEARTGRDRTEAELLAATKRYELTVAAPLPEEVARADGAVAAAQAKAASIAAMLDRCSIKAPMSGVVLRRNVEPGESSGAALGKSLLSLVDTSVTRVRAEVDERDIGRVRRDRSARVIAEALQAEPFTAKVVNLGHLMGRKRVRSGDPAEKADRDVMEVLVELDRPEPRLVIGLRVTVQFLE